MRSSLGSVSGRTGVLALLASLSLLACSSSSKETPAGAGGGGNADSGPVKPAGKGDWTTLGYSTASNYWNTEETKITKATAPNLEQAWVFDTKWSGVSSTPIISGGRVYVMVTQDPTDPAHVGGVIAIDLATGDELWRNTDVQGQSTLAIEDGVIYANDAGGIVHALDASKNGAEIWQFKPDDDWGLVGFSSPVLTKDLVLVGASGLEEVTSLPPGAVAKTRGFVLAINKKTGKQAWKKYNCDLPSTGVGVWSTISVDEEAGIAVVGTGNTYTGEPSPNADAFLAIPLKDGGDYLWHPQIIKGDVFPGKPGSPDGDFGANPILFEYEGKKLAAGGAKMGDVWVVDRADGTVLKQRNIGPASSFKGGVFVNGAWDGKSLLFACNGAKSTGAGSETPATSAVGTLFALDPLTLDIKWERQYNVGAWGFISVANGVGFFGKDKTLQAFDTETGAILKEFPTEGTISTVPSISNGYVVFGSGMSWILGPTPGTKYYAVKVP